jgi:hypothetical protein
MAVKAWPRRRTAISVQRAAIRVAITMENLTPLNFFSFFSPIWSVFAPSSPRRSYSTNFESKFNFLFDFY